MFRVRSDYLIRPFLKICSKPNIVTYTFDPSAWETRYRWISQSTEQGPDHTRLHVGTLSKRKKHFLINWTVLFFVHLELKNELFQRQSGNVAASVSQQFTRPISSSGHIARLAILLCSQVWPRQQVVQVVGCSYTNTSVPNKQHPPILSQAGFLPQ